MGMNKIDISIGNTYINMNYSCSLITQQQGFLIRFLFLDYRLVPQLWLFTRWMTMVESN